MCFYSLKRIPFVPQLFLPHTHTHTQRRRRRAFRRQVYAALSQTLLNLRPIVVHNEKEDGSRSLGRSSDTTYYDGSARARRKRDSQIPVERESQPVYTGGDARLWRNQNRPLFVTSGYLAGHFRTPSRYILLLATVAYQIFRCRARNSPSNIIVGCSTSRCRSVGPDLPTSSRQYMYACVRRVKQFPRFYATRE